MNIDRKAGAVVAEKASRLMCVLICAALLCGCDYEDIAVNLNQRQANEIVAVLNSHGIRSRAKMTRGTGSQFKVQVRDGDYTIAVSILNAAGLPKPAEASFEQLTASHGIIPSSREVEAARLDHALSREVEEKLAGLPGIASVKVIIRSKIMKEAQEPSAAVFVEESAEGAVDVDQIADIMSLVVPEITPGRIKVEAKPRVKRDVRISTRGVGNKDGVVVYRQLVPFLSFMSIPEGEYKKLAGAFLFFFVIVSILGFFFGFLLGRRQEAIKRAEKQLASEGMHIGDISRFLDHSLEQQSAERSLLENPVETADLE